MSNILSQYYKGVTQHLRSEVTFINSLFSHQGLKGEGNENALRDLLVKFIPKKYGIGTGIVIDRHGNLVVSVILLFSINSLILHY